MHQNCRKIRSHACIKTTDKVDTWMYQTKRRKRSIDASRLKKEKNLSYMYQNRPYLVCIKTIEIDRLVCIKYSIEAYDTYYAIQNIDKPRPYMYQNDRRRLSLYAIQTIEKPQPDQHPIHRKRRCHT